MRLGGIRCAFLFMIFGAWYAWAGGGPHNTLVIVNDNSPHSQELGQYYQDLRGLPERHVVHVRATTNYTASLADFTNQVVQPVRAYIAAAGLSNQIDYLVLTRDLPYRVFDGGVTYNGASAVLYYGFKVDGPPCSLTSAARSDYYAAETAFTRSGSPSSNRYYLSSIVTGQDLDQARRTLDRSMSSDASFPAGRVAFLHTVDNFRTVRWTQFDDAQFSSRFRTQGILPEIVNSSGFSEVSNLVGYLTGVDIEPFIHLLGFVPGALTDSLTSYGGYLLDPVGHTSILEWLKRGAAGSYGTVVEPCNYTNKYSQARLHYWYGRGFNLAESYAMAVQYPYMGVVVGDPLTAPYAQPPSIVVSGLVASAVVTSDVTLAISASTTGAAGRVGRLDALLDGLWLGSITSRPPTAGNTVSVTINGTTRTATVQVGDSLERVTSRLATAINAMPPFPYTARAFGDRVEIVQDDLGTTGAWISVSAASGTGVASRLTVFAQSVFTNFLESEVTAKEGLSLSGVPVSGDVVRVVITRLDSVIVTNQVVATTNDTDALLMVKLRDSINTDTNLAGASGCYADWATHLTADKELWLVARTNGWPGYNLQVTYSILTNLGSTLNTGFGFSDNFDDNGDTLAARATVFLTEGETNLTASWTLAVTNLPDGPHALTVVAYDGSAVRVQGSQRLPFTVDRHSLTCAITNPVNGRYLLRGGAVTTEVSAVSPGSVTQVQVYVEGKLFASTSSLPYQFVWPTTNYGAGALGVQALAQDDGGRATLSEVVTVQLYSDDDGDGLPDQWEYRALGSATNGVAGDDPDGDGQNNQAEFLADTDPRNALSRHEVSAIRLAEGIELEMPVRTSRTFQVEYSDADLSAPSWQSALQNLPPSTGLVTWLDTPTNAPAATNGFRLYRVRADLP